jgi:hypothetical protein
MGQRDKSKRKVRREEKAFGLPLRDGESIVLVARPSILVTWPKYVYTLGLYGAWRKRHTAVVTSHRVLVNKGVFARSERSIPFDRIDDATFIRRGYAGYTDVRLARSNRVERIGPFQPWQARRFTSEILAHR